MGVGQRGASFSLPASQNIKYWVLEKSVCTKNVLNKVMKTLRALIFRCSFIFFTNLIYILGTSQTWWDQASGVKIIHKFSMNLSVALKVIDRSMLIGTFITISDTTCVLFTSVAFDLVQCWELYNLLFLCHLSKSICCGLLWYTHSFFLFWIFFFW